MLNLDWFQLLDNANNYSVVAVHGVICSLPRSGKFKSANIMTMALSHFNNSKTDAANSCIFGTTPINYQNLNRKQKKIFNWIESHHNDILREHQVEAYQHITNSGIFFFF